MTDINTMRAQAAPPPAEGPPKWEFKDRPGAEFFGQVTHTKLHFEVNGKPAHLMEVRDHQLGPITVWLTAVQLATFFVEGRNPLGRPVQVGDIVYGRFDGTVTLDNGNSLNTFSCNIAAGPGGPAQPQTVPMPQVQQPYPQQAPPQQPTIPSGPYAGQPQPPQGWTQPQQPQQADPQQHFAPDGSPVPF